MRFTLPPGNRPEPSRWGWIMIAVFACASARAFFWLIYPVGDEWKILSPNNLGDLSLHLSFIHWLSSTGGPEAPSLPGIHCVTRSAPIFLMRCFWLLEFPPQWDCFGAV